MNSTLTRAGVSANILLCILLGLGIDCTARQPAAVAAPPALALDGDVTNYSTPVEWDASTGLWILDAASAPSTKNALIRSLDSEHVEVLFRGDPIVEVPRDLYPVVLTSADGGFITFAEDGTVTLDGHPATDAEIGRFVRRWMPPFARTLLETTNVARQPLEGMRGAP